MNISPRLVMADAGGNILDDPQLLMVCDRAGQWSLPRPADLMPLPPESELFLLPGRNAVGLNPETGKMERVDELAVAAFVAPGHTISAHPAFARQEDAPMLPLFAYGAVGFADDRFWVCASRVDDDPRQQFAKISPGRIEREARALLARCPRNRLVAHVINNCVRRYGCPAARNFALGRFEAPVPTSRACNARCAGCISLRQPDSPVEVTPQCRLAFTPTVDEIVELMAIHEQREKSSPIYSFGQGCEGDPLTGHELLAQAIAGFRALRGTSALGGGTVNCNTNASRPDAVAELARAGLTSMRVSLNSARPEFYEAYYRPVDYSFSDVCQSIRTARQLGVFVSLNLLYFPGITDTFEELDSLAVLCRDHGVSMIQWRNLNIDPEWYASLLGPCQKGRAPDLSMGLRQFMKRLRKLCPWLRFGYFNPFLGERAAISAPMPS